MSDTQSTTNTHSERKRKVLRKKPESTMSTKRYVWLAGHILTLVFGIAYDVLYITLRSRSTWLAPLFYRTSLLGVLACYTLTILTVFGSRAIPSYFTLLATENFRYLLVAILWFFSGNSLFKLLPYTLISILHLGKYLKLRPVLRLETIFKKIIVYNELYVMLVLLADTFMLRGDSGFALVGYIMIYWLRLLYSPQSRQVLYFFISRMDGVVKSQKNKYAVSIWDNFIEYLKRNQDYDAAFVEEENKTPESPAPVAKENVMNSAHMSSKEHLVNSVMSGVSKVGGGISGGVSKGIGAPKKVLSMASSKIPGRRGSNG
ncbi:BA75_02221T0 [Komagataella pastoris]|uniref:BA75_02221T0 n=1 Tax=Komagataella pastoris TaxID=4922 RepID=A0A1B2JAD5_PICPA|nr:BA75_02221T0 [Komagataella pastoris]